MFTVPLVILLLALIGLRELFSAALGGHHVLIVLAEIAVGALAFHGAWLLLNRRFGPQAPPK